MKTLKSLSVIIPIFNGVNFIHDAVASVLSQSFLPPAFEILLIDDGSSDNSFAACRKLESKCSHIKFIPLMNNCGVARARNLGVEHSIYEHLAFLDQDDLWAPEKLAIQAQAIEEHPDIDYLLSLQSFSLLGLISYPKWFKDKWTEGPQKGYVFGSMLIQKSIFTEVGFLNEAYRYGDDMDWFVRAQEAEMRELMLPYPLLLRRVHDNNASQRTSHSSSELLKLIKAKLDRAL